VNQQKRNKFTNKRLITTNKRRRYASWGERMVSLLNVDGLDWKDDTIIIPKKAVGELFPEYHTSKRFFQFQRTYGKKGSMERFDIVVNNVSETISLTHRSKKMTKKLILSLYE